ncbi:MAG: 30S ribosomal protein S12 methylthiotransferase RimO [Treponema sp.]|nr:30S ribosomal protein S12 methylthiotransferase RimO [Treponema sp.]
MDKSKKFFLDQHGCAKNQVDGEIITTHLESLGYIQTDNSSDADLIIVNSCGFIASAKEESINSIMDFRSAYPDKKILLAGCLAERYADVFDTEMPEADGFFGNGDLTQIGSVVASIFNDERPNVRPPQKGVCCADRNILLSFKGSAYVKITEGCNNRCTFCAIPIIRGELRSRKCDEIVQEIQKLVQEKNVREINLIGQDLAAYGYGKDDDVMAGSDGTASFLSMLVERISGIKGDFWVRLLYIHPDHFNVDLLEAMKKDPRFLPYFDIPFQSGDDGIIKSMNRKGPSKTYVELVKKIRSVFPEACIRTTFLTGFPGEDEDAFSNTADFLRQIQSDWSGCFSYSPEDGTPAEKLKGRVPKKIAEKRAHELEKIQSEITAGRLNERIGKVYDVLVEEIIENKSGTDEGLAIGRAWFDAPEVDGNFVIRYDLDDADAVKAIVPGARIKAKALASSEVDIDGVYVAG